MNPPMAESSVHDSEYTNEHTNESTNHRRRSTKGVSRRLNGLRETVGTYCRQRLRHKSRGSYTVSTPQSESMEQASPRHSEVSDLSTDPRSRTGGACSLVSCACDEVERTPPKICKSTRMWKNLHEWFLVHGGRDDLDSSSASGYLGDDRILVKTKRQWEGLDKWFDNQGAEGERIFQVIPLISSDEDESVPDIASSVFVNITVSEKFSEDTIHKTAIVHRPTWSLIDWTSSSSDCSDEDDWEISYDSDDRENTPESQDNNVRTNNTLRMMM
ncbi:uncharacterized protein LOC106013447 isoform X2 [Aplysia californica]|uniref:Uncharacterized protein LOC106013447 isoform X2 n=1 Tax=Aplysia californica TaxID=6500 RepID=A0ABM1ABT8_APLCA|nr:uncharacterized protein LOC106013447 isoform X2 [Aplysia californica]